MCTTIFCTHYFYFEEETMKTKNAVTILNCPHCKAEYFPNEIILPSYLIGKERDVVKDSEGKIVTYKSSGCITQEKYICDYCNKPFKVNVKLQYQIDSDNGDDFSEDYVLFLKKPDLFSND